MRAKLRAVLLLLLALLLLGSRQLRANEADPKEAVRLGHEGLTLYEEGKWDEAFARFEQANQTAHSPVFVLYMARCRRVAGRLLEAARLLEELFKSEASAEAPADAPVAWSNALRDGRAELNALHLRIPSLKIAGRGVSTARLDGEVVATNESIDVDPGEHVVQGWSSEGRLSVRRVVLSEGQRDLVVTLSFEPARPANAKPATLGLQQEPVSDVPRPNRTAFWITGGAAVGFAVLGTVTGLIATSQTNSIRNECNGDTCPERLQDEADRARRLANISTAAFGVAGVNLAFSVGFLLWPE